MEEFKRAVSDLLEAGVIRESRSPYASPVVLVRKKDGGLRVRVDFRKLNAKTIKDAYPIPRIAETLEALQGAKWFCSLDLQSGYLQVGVRERDKPKTAMTTPFGLYEFNRMPFGLTNAPATFQRLMERCLVGLNLRICLVYLDDIIVFGRSFEEVLERLETMLKRLGYFEWEWAMGTWARAEKRLVAQAIRGRTKKKRFSLHSNQNFHNFLLNCKETFSHMFEPIAFTFCACVQFS